MSNGCQSLIRAIEEWAPLNLAEDWDNCGLQVGDREQEIHKVFVALTPSLAVVERALAIGADMIVTHHPLVFKPMKQVTADTELGKIIRLLLKNDICLYSAHTNLDITGGGVNDILAEKLAISQTKPLEVSSVDMAVGLGRIGELPTAMSQDEFLQYVSQNLEQPNLTYAGKAAQIKKVALCGGSAAGYMVEAKAQGADAYVTGDVKYHDGQLAAELGILLIDAGHFATERAIVEVMAEFLRSQQVEVVIDVAEEDFLQHFQLTNN